MDYYSRQITRLIEELSALPGIGKKSAQRLAFHIISMPEERVNALAEAMTGARKNIRYCRECFTLTDDELCPICRSAAINHRQIMVVENTRDLAAYEKTGKYDGVYHVLHGAISPMLGIGPGDIRLKELMRRLEGDVGEYGGGFLWRRKIEHFSDLFKWNNTTPVMPRPQSGPGPRTEPAQKDSLHTQKADE